MNESDYDLLASTCDRLLRAPGTDRARLAIGLLHVIHEHPSWLAQYRNVFMPGGRRLRDRRLIRGARDLYRMARGIRTSLWSVPNPTAAGARDASPDVLIVSRLTSDAQLARGDDFYFGAMPDLLRARRANVIVALVDHRYSTGHGESTAPGLGQLLLPKWLPPHDELALWKQCAGSRAALAGEAHAMRDPFDRALARLAAEEALSAVTAANLRLHARVKEICFRLRPRIVLTTFEGDASERMIFLGARQSGVEPLCVGYQHTRLLPRAHAIKRALAVSGLPCDPDVVLTLGEETRTRLDPPRHRVPATSPGSVWWEPLGDYGPPGKSRNMYDDYFASEDLRIRIGTSFTRSREDRFSNLDQSSPENTSLYNSDGVLTFSTGAFAPGVTVDKATYRMWAIDGGLKWKGLAVNGQYYFRWVDDFVADGPLPLASTFDHGFELVAGGFVIPRKLMAYGRGSMVFGEFRDSWEVAAGVKWYFLPTERLWISAELMRTVDVPYSGAFTPYTAGMTAWVPMIQTVLAF